jgi:hypothetical protein
MKKIPLTQGKFAIVDDEDFAMLSVYKWHCMGDGWNVYAVRCPQRKEYTTRNTRKSIRMHRVILGYTGKLVVDHINGDSLDNRKKNLRICSHRDNIINSGMRKNNTSGFKGVTWREKNHRWVVTIQTGERQIEIGTFVDKIEAAIAYNDAAKKYHGEFARLNIL